MRASLDALEDVEMVTQCRYQAPKTLFAAIATVQMVESFRLAAGATARGVRSAKVNMVDVTGPVGVDATPLTINAVAKAFHAALEPKPSTPALPAQGSQQRPGR